MATVLTIAHVSRNNNDTGLKFEQVFTKLARFWEFQGKDPGVCFEAKLKGSRQGFSEGLSQAEGLRTGLQGRAFFSKKGLWVCFQFKSDRVPRKGPWGMP